MNQPHRDEFFDVFSKKTTELAMSDFGYISAESWKCQLASIPKGTIQWTWAPRVYINHDHIGFTNNNVDRRFRRNFFYQDYHSLSELLDDFIPYLTNILNRHNGDAKRKRDLIAYHRKEDKGAF